MVLVNWPAAEVAIVEVPNPYRHIDEFEPERLEYRQRIPPSIARRPSLMLDHHANRALRDATSALSELTTATTQTSIRIDPLLTEILIRLEAVSSSQIEDLDANVEEILIQQEGPDDDTGRTLS